MMTPLLPAVEKPRHPMLKAGYVFTRKQFGVVPGPLSVFCARVPFAFSGFYGKVSKLDKKLSLDPDTALLIRQQVARCNVCSYCIDANRWAAIKSSDTNADKFDALDEYHTSPLFTDAERAALDYVTQVTTDKHVRPETFAALGRHYGERQICEIVWLVASEHLYNITNVALNIGSDGYCKIPAAGAAA